MNASKGDGNAMYEIGLNYYNGTDFTQDIDRGLKMYTYAARQGDSHAQFTLGKIYEEGQDVQADYSKASQYYSMISATDICGFDFSLADKYLNEKLLTRDNKKSFFILKRGDSNRGSFKLQ
jgi:TPR repeat protein